MKRGSRIVFFSTPARENLVYSDTGAVHCGTALRKMAVGRIYLSWIFNAWNSMISLPSPYWAWTLGLGDDHRFKIGAIPNTSTANLHHARRTPWESCQTLFTLYLHMHNTLCGVDSINCMRGQPRRAGCS